MRQLTVLPGAEQSQDGRRLSSRTASLHAPSLAPGVCRLQACGLQADDEGLEGIDTERVVRSVPASSQPHVPGMLHPHRKYKCLLAARRMEVHVVAEVVGLPVLYTGA